MVWFMREISRIADFNQKLHARIRMTVHHASKQPYAWIIGYKSSYCVSLCGRWNCISYWWSIKITFNLTSCVEVFNKIYCYTRIIPSGQRIRKLKTKVGLFFKENLNIYNLIFTAWEEIKASRCPLRCIEWLSKPLFRPLSIMNSSTSSFNFNSM